MFAQESVMEIQEENNLIQEAFEVEADEFGFCLDRKWGDYEKPYTALAFNLFKKGWQAAKAQAVLEWISTSERMPEEGEEVFVHSYGQVRQATRDSSWAGGFKERNCYGWQATYSQSHWMPKNIELPEEYHFYYKNDAKQKAMLETQEPAND
jgi:hypothetical protein